MSILARFSPPSMTADQYDAIVARLYKEGIHPADGLELEVCFGSGDQMKVSLLFDSMDSFEKFGECLQRAHVLVLISFSLPYHPN